MLRVLAVGCVGCFAFVYFAISNGPVNGVATQESAEAPAPEEAQTERELFEGPKLKELKSMTELQAVLAMSGGKPIFLYKHSTQCPISAKAAARVEDYAKAKATAEDAAAAPVDFYWVKVIEARPISNAIAEGLKVEHESPQILLLADGKAVWDTSHEKITAESMDEALEKNREAADKES